MGIVLYIFNYLVWHYTRAIKDLLHIWLDFIWFVFNFFSISLLVKTFFAPWKRLGEERRGLFDFTFITIDIFMRLFGMLLRGITIIVGILAVFSTTLMLLPALLIWILWPIIIVYLINKGLSYLIL